MQETSFTTVLTQAQFDEYARLSGDDNPIHVDPGFAAGTRFGRTVAHGMHLFGMLQAAHARYRSDPVSLSSVEFMFRAPTYADDPVSLTITPVEPGRFEETVRSSNGEVTVSGFSRFGAPSDRVPDQPLLEESAGYRGLEVGMSATRKRTFTIDDVAAYLRLVDDPNPRFSAPKPQLPPALLTGTVSCVLGVDLPGWGTNWLKQHFEFHRAAVAPVEVTTTVTITRIRSDKGLINLESRTAGADGVLVSGKSLVLAVDAGPR
jgi:acyl dehydratase